MGKSTPVIKTGTFEHDIAVTGEQKISGIGFRPDTVLFYAGVGADTGSGLDNGTDAFSLFTRGDAYTLGTVVGTGQAIYLVTANGVYAYAKITAKDNDSFTLTWAKNGAPTGTAKVLYVAIKG